MTYLYRNPLQLAQKIDPQQIDKFGSTTRFTLEPKYDGFRAGIIVRNGEVDIYSRTHKSQRGKMPTLEKQLSKLPNMHLDGELVSLSAKHDVDGITIPESDFNMTMRILNSRPAMAVREQKKHGPIVFMMFDLLGFKETDIRRMPWGGRIEMRDMIYDSFLHGVDHLLPSPFLPPTRASYDAIVASGGEGAVLKNRAMTYTGKRDKAWMKVKAEHIINVVISGFTAGNGKYRDTIGAIQFDQYVPANDAFVRRGQCSGVDDDLRHKMAKNPEHYIGTVMAVKHAGYGTQHGLRHPRFVKFCIDKTPKDCVWSHKCSSE